MVNRMTLAQRHGIADPLHGLSLFFAGLLLFCLEKYKIKDDNYKCILVIIEIYLFCRCGKVTKPPPLFRETQRALGRLFIINVIQETNFDLCLAGSYIYFCCKLMNF